MIDRFHTNNRMSLMVRYPAQGKNIVLSGLVPDNTNVGIAEQTQQVLDKIDSLLAEAGATKSDLTHLYIWLAHITDFNAMNEVYDCWVLQGEAPARACVEARLANPGIRVEIQAYAVTQ